MTFILWAHSPHRPTLVPQQGAERFKMYSPNTICVLNHASLIIKYIFLLNIPNTTALARWFSTGNNVSPHLGPEMLLNLPYSAQDSPPYERLIWPKISSTKAEKSASPLPDYMLKEPPASKKCNLLCLPHPEYFKRSPERGQMLLSRQIVF